MALILSEDQFPYHHLSTDTESSTWGYVDRYCVIEKRLQPTYCHVRAEANSFFCAWNLYDCEKAPDLTPSRYSQFADNVRTRERMVGCMHLFVANSWLHVT